MTTESLWYSSYSSAGEAPTCKRYCRLPMDQQWSLVIDFAIAYAEGRAGYRQTYIARTREKYWFCPHPLSDTGWWIIPDRIERRVFALNRDAASHVMRNNHGVADSRQIAAALIAWKRSGVWRKHASSIAPRRGTESDLKTYLRRSLRKRRSAGEI
jgi:hypothetical protein